MTDDRVTADRTALILQRAAAIADEVLFPVALDVDRADRVPPSHLDLLAKEGFYGVAAPPEDGGLGVGDMSVAGRLLEVLASGCLSTTFVWMQHHGAVLGAAFSPIAGVRERWLGPLARGERRAALALAGLRPGPTPLRVRREGGWYVLDGEVPWVTGWDMTDTAYLAARDDDDVVHFLLVDAQPADTQPADTQPAGTQPADRQPADTQPAGTVAVRALDLVAAQASRTVNLVFTGHRVPADRLLDTQPYAEWAAGDASGSALNGFLALGVANRCLRMLGPGPLDAELDACRAALSEADAGATPAARAAASALAVRAAAALMVRSGARAVLRDNHAQRLAREAAFLLVFGSRPPIRDALSEHYLRAAAR